MQLFYNPNLEVNTQEFTFDKVESKHIVRVLRKREGDTLFITNGNGYLFTSEIVLASDKKCLVRIIEVEEKAKPRSYYLHIAIAPTKNNDRFEWFLEKATEIGIDEITPIICEHSERKVVKTERLQKILESAGKQSLKFHFPKLNGAIKFSELMDSPLSGQKFIAHCEDHQLRNALQKTLKPKEDALILIGPEGDFSTNEIEKATSNNFTPITLGSSRLRTETAGIVATHTVALLNAIQ